MPKLTLIIGAALVALGVGGYWASGMVSLTALIPAVFGVVLMLLGLIGSRPRHRRSANLASLVIALLGTFGAIPGLINLLQAASGAALKRPEAAISQTVMAALCVALVAATAQAAVRAWRRGRHTAT